MPVGANLKVLQAHKASCLGIFLFLVGIPEMPPMNSCNIRESIDNRFHTLDRMYTMYTYPSYDRMLSTIGLSLETGAPEARMNESGQLVIRSLVPSGPRKLVVRNSWLLSWNQGNTVVQVPLDHDVNRPMIRGCSTYATYATFVAAFQCYPTIIPDDDNDDHL